MFVVAGVTGHTGSVVAETLLERKQRVRVIVRTPEKGEIWRAKGAEAAVASLDDPRALAETLQGATGAYVLIPPDDKASDYLDDRKKVVDALVFAAEASRLSHVVFLSAMGAHLPAGTGPVQVLHDGERRLGSAVHSLTVLRAAYFMDNWASAVGTARSQGILPSFLSPTRKIPMIATRDVGHMAAECLLDHCRGTRILELSGPSDYSPTDVAEAMGRQLRRKISVRYLSLEAVVPALTSIGCSDNVAGLFKDLYAGIESGYIAYEGNGAAHPRGIVTLSEAVSEWMSSTKKKDG